MTNPRLFRPTSGQHQKRSSIGRFCNELGEVQSGRVRAHKDGARPVVFCVEPLESVALNVIEPIEEEE
ncbi:hypothetical protein ACFLSZ_06130 [Candidatus Bipolaricaulota bacterium]